MREWCGKCSWPKTSTPRESSLQKWLSLGWRARRWTWLWSTSSPSGASSSVGWAAGSPVTRWAQTPGSCPRSSWPAPRRASSDPQVIYNLEYKLFLGQAQALGLNYNNTVIVVGGPWHFSVSSEFGLCYFDLTFRHFELEVGTRACTVFLTWEIFQSISLPAF